jgi:thiol-disulfide isomerase/thioredoxin
MKRMTFWLKMGLVVVLAWTMTVSVGCAKEEPVATEPETEAVATQEDADVPAKAPKQEPNSTKPQATDGPEVGIQVGNSAPDFEIPLLSGGTMRLSDLRGKPVLINFMTTWCPPCQKEFPAVQQIHEEYGDQVLVLAISVGEPREDVAASFGDLPYTFEIAYDTDDLLYADYQIDFIPQSFFIDADGVIVDYLSGGSTYPAFEAGVKKLL